MSAIVPPRFDVGELFNGDELSFTLGGLSGLTGVPLVCTVRTYRDSLHIIARCSIADGGIVVPADTSLTVAFGSDRTERWPVRELWYDVQADPSSIVSWTVCEGPISMMRRITRSRTTNVFVGTGALATQLEPVGFTSFGALAIQGAIAAALSPVATSAQSMLAIAGALNASLAPASLAAAGGLAPLANAGIDAAYDMLGATAYSLAGGAAGPGPITYGWVKFSGPGAVTFSDATNPLSTAAFSAHGTYELDLTATNAFGSHTDRVVITVTANLSVLLARMATGSRVNAGWKVGISTETLNGSNFSQLNDLGSTPGNLHCVQATAGSQPSKVVGGGATGGNCITFQDVARTLYRGSIGVASGKMLAFYGRSKATAGAGAFRGQWTCREADALFSLAYAGTAATANFESGIRCAGAAQDDKIFTSPAVDANWHVWSTTYAAGVAPVTKIDNVAVAPVYTVGTGAARGWTNVNLGYGNITASNAAGSMDALLVFEAVSTSVPFTGGLSEDGAIRYYMAL